MYNTRTDTCSNTDSCIDLFSGSITDQPGAIRHPSSASPQSLVSNDQLALRQAEPEWDQIRKIWVYESMVQLVQFNDITAPVAETFTIKRQSEYYIWADDRKESVPVMHDYQPFFRIYPSGYPRISLFIMDPSG